MSELASRNPNDFIRKLPSHKVIGLGFIKLDGKSWYIAGADTPNIYLCNWVVHNKLLRINYRNKKSYFNSIIDQDSLQVYQGVYIRIDLTNLYLLDGIKPTIVKGELSNLKLSHTQKTPHFTSAIPLSPNSFILRVVGKERRNILVKLTNEKIIFSYLLEKQGDGIFSTDGMLIKSQDGSKLFYSFYYRNQFLCLDTNLNILYKGKTIDTVSHAKVKIGRINSLHETTLAAPPQFVNEQCSANNEYLFIHSALKADNEINAEMNEVNPIDVYSIKDGKYKFSIYIANFNEEKLRDFKVVDKKLIALYDHYLYIHQLNF